MLKHAGAGGQPTRAWCTTRSTTRAGPACRCCRRPTRSRARSPARPPRRPSTSRPSAAQGARLFGQYDPAFADPLLATAAHGLGRGPGAPGGLRTGGGGQRRRRGVRRRRRHRRVLLGGGGAVPHHRRRRRSSRPCSTARSTPATSSRPTGSAGGAPRRSVASTWPPSRTTCPVATPIRRRSWPRADGYVASQAAQAFGLPTRRASGQYAWGATARRGNNLVVVATAYDLTGDATYRAVPSRGDGLPARPQRAQPVLRDRLGRGRLRTTSTAAGSRTRSTRPCRIRRTGRSPAARTRVEHVGPDDAGDASRRAARRVCYLDYIQSWSTNEITVNWNSALSWVASFVADQGDGGDSRSRPSSPQDPTAVTAALGATASFTAAARAHRHRPCSGRSRRGRDRGRTSWEPTSPTLEVTVTASLDGAATGRCSPTPPGRPRRRRRS